MDQKIQNLKDYIKSVKQNRPFCGTGVYTTLWYIKGLEKALNILEGKEQNKNEKLYFDDDCFDYWEREKIWNCRTNEWEVENVETSNN